MPARWVILNKPIPHLFDEQGAFFGALRRNHPLRSIRDGMLKEKRAQDDRQREQCFIIAKPWCAGFWRGCGTGHPFDGTARKKALVYLLSLLTEEKVSRIPLARARDRFPPNCAPMKRDLQSLICRGK
jgi:hypothetical protein